MTSSKTHTIKVPDLGEGIAEVELVVWHVKLGDLVSEDHALADVMTDKATVEIPSPVSGRVVKLGGEVGQVMAVGSALIEIESAEDAGAVAPAPVTAATKATVPPPPAAPAPVPKATVAAPKASTTKSLAERPIASPALRRRAWELGIALEDLRPSGPSGRILQADLEAHVAAEGPRRAAAAGPAVRATAASAAPAASATPVAMSAALLRREGQHEIKIIGLRRRIAVQMQEAKRRIPHFSYVEEVDVTELEALRAQLNQRHASTRGKLTLLPLLARAMVLAAADFPMVNARFDDEAGVITRHDAVHLGVATQTEHGLMVPVLRHAEALDPWAAAAEIARLAAAARSGRATRDELSGSTITISSLGALGGIVSTPVINRPEVGIVAVNRIVEKVVWRNGAAAPRLTMNLSSSFDHRVVDGHDAASFVQAMRQRLETPALLFVA